MRLSVEGGSTTPSTVIKKAPVLSKAPVKYTPPKASYSPAPIQKAAARVSKPVVSVVKKPVISLPKSPTAVAKGDPYTRMKTIQAAAKAAPKIISPPKTTTAKATHPNGWKLAPVDIGPTSKTVAKPVAKPVVKPSTGSSGGKSGGSSPSSSGKPTPAKTTTTPRKTTTDPAALANAAKLTALWAQANGYKGQIDSMLKAGFSYDPSKDASYQALQTLAQKNAKIASKDAMETMNDRGILNSTVTGDRIAQVEQTAQDAVTAQVPVLQNAAYNRYNDKINTLNNLYTSLVGQAQVERTTTDQENQWQKTYDQTNTQNAIQNNQWQQTMNHTIAQDSVNNGQENARIDLAQRNYTLSEAAQIQSSTGFRNDVETNKALGEIVTMKTADDAWNYLNQNAERFINSGVSISDLVANVNKRFPNSSKSKAATNGLSFTGK